MRERLGENVMKKLIVTFIMVSLMGSVALADTYPGSTYELDGPMAVPGDPTAFTISNNDLATWDIFQPSALSATDTDDDVPGIGWDVPGLNNAEFNFEGFDFGGATWASGQLGWSMFETGTADDTLPTSYYDLSAYDKFTVSFHNEVFGPVEAGDTDHAVMAALFINTGWTDAPWSQTDEYYQGDWVWAVPCDNLILELDLSGIDDAELQYVSSIGVQIGSNLYDGTNWGIADGTGFKVCIDTVPLPGAVLLGFLGLSAAGLKLRKSA
jgi:hypothetical protein